MESAIKFIKKKIIKKVLDYIMDEVEEIEIDEAVDEWVEDLCREKFSKEELLSEGEDALKWIKGKLKGKLKK